MSVLNIDLDDNVGDGLAKINYNILSLSNDTCKIKSNQSKNSKFLNEFETFLNNLDQFLGDFDFDLLEKMDSTVSLLSSYWTNFEFSVIYPFNPVTGYISSLTKQGDLGIKKSSDISVQKTNLNSCLINKKLVKTTSEANEAISYNQILYVLRDDNGQFTSWDFLDSSKLVNISTDNQNNIFYNGRLIDVYYLPRYSAIISSDVNPSLNNFTINFNTKSVTLQNKVISYVKTSLSQNSLLNYVTDVSKSITSTGISDVTSYAPKVEVLSKLIPAQNTDYASIIKKLNTVILQNNLKDNVFVNSLCLTFLDKNYPASKYVDNTTVTVMFLLYNQVGFDLAYCTDECTYFDYPTSSRKLTKTNNYRGNNIDIISPGSNSEHIVVFSKTDSYIEKISHVKFVKKSMFISKTKTNHYWEFESISNGSLYKPGSLEIKTNLPTAPVYTKKPATLQEIQLFPTTFLTKKEDILTTKQGDTFLLAG